MSQTDAVFSCQEMIGSDVADGQMAASAGWRRCRKKRRSKRKARNKKKLRERGSQPHQPLCRGAQGRIPHPRMGVTGHNLHGGEGQYAQ